MLTRTLFSVALLLAVSCSPGMSDMPPPTGEPPPVEAPLRTEPVVGSGATREDPIRTCGARRSYEIVASLRCTDGSVPLNGEWDRAKQARTGTTGPGPDGHMLDLYYLPCAVNPPAVYVDIFHCRGGRPDGH